MANVLLRLEDVIERVKLGSSTIYRRIKTNSFPAPRYLGPGCVRWLESEINEWIASLPSTAAQKGREAEKKMKDRWLSPKLAADYLDVRVDALPRLVRAGRVPAPDYSLGPRSPRYDREALDKAMGLGSGSTEADRALERYLKKRQGA